MGVSFLSRAVTVLCTLALLASAPQVDAAKQRQDPATVTLAADLRRSHAAGSPVLSSLVAGQKVTVLGMRGSQAQVKAGDKTGWMPVSKLRMGSDPAASGSGGSDGGSSFLRSLTGMLGGGGSSSGGGAKVTIGIRGLQKKDLANAQPDPAAVDRMERFKASPAAGQAHASAVGLRSYELAYRASSAPASLSGASGAPAASTSGTDN